MARRNTLAFVMACLLGAPQLASSHTWVEQLNRVASNGTLVGPAGFSNGWAGREEGFSDPRYTNRMPEDGFQMCKQGLQGQQSAQFPNLAAAPGDFISMRYQENGHVTKPESSENKPLNRGTVFIYGTTDPKAGDTLFDVHRQWTADGKGGDGRGKLLATRNYDDGQCYQVNDGPISNERQAQFPHEAAQPMGVNLWCQTAVQLPEDIAKNSDYTLYWVWSWPKLKESAVAASKNGQFADFPSGFKDDKRAVTSDDVTIAEIYTSCSTIKVQGEKLVSSSNAASTSGQGTTQGVSKAFNFPAKPDYNDAAIRDQLETQFLVEVDGAGSGTPGNSKPGNGTQTRIQSSDPAAVPTLTPSASEKVRTVTVTAAAQTLYKMITVTVPAQANPTPSQDQNRAVETSAKPSVTPFIKGLRGRHIRGRDTWNFNQGN